MPLEVVRNDITKMYVDAIVNTADYTPNYFSGTDTAVYMAAGAEDLLAERQKIGYIEFGTAAVTDSYQLHEHDVKYIIHAVSPFWSEDPDKDGALLRATYDSILQLALERDCKSLACPLLSAGNKGFPHEFAIDIAIDAFRDFLKQHEMQIYLVLFDFLPMQYASRLFKGIESFVDDAYVELKQQMEYGFASADFDALDKAYGVCNCAAPLEAPEIPPIPAVPSDESFVHMLDRLMDERGLKPGDIYNRSSITKQMISKLHCTDNYAMRKDNVLALAFILKLDYATACDFLSRADYAFNPASKRDAYLQECLEQGQYNTYKIDDALYERDMPCIFFQ